MSLKNLPVDLKPREKALYYGIDKLTDVELLALIIQTGSHKMDALELSKTLLTNFGSLDSLSKSDALHLQIPGIKKAKALKLMACFEIAKRLKGKETYHMVLDSKEKVLQSFGLSLSSEKEEIFEIVCLDKHSRLIRCIKLNSNSESNVSLSPKKVMSEILSVKASKVYLLHNHPSGILSPSKDDLLSTFKLNELCQDLGVKLIDHFIVFENSYYSFSDQEIKKIIFPIDNNIVH